ncbi:MAG: hypothetical protein CL529_06455 [Aequorivita sp.]|nr:hypothetical protein [Aequorivita sp.]
MHNGNFKFKLLKNKENYSFFFPFITKFITIALSTTQTTAKTIIIAVPMPQFAKGIIAFIII